MRAFFRNAVSVFLASIALAPPALCRADGTNADAIHQDSRLHKLVTVSTRSLPLKALLDEFSRQSGVELTMDEGDSASSYRVLVACKNVPVARMMDALYRLVSIRGGEWAWVRTGKPAAYSYALYETFAAKNRAANYDRILNGLLTHFVETMRRLAPMTMEERKRHREELKQSIGLDSEALMASFFDSDWFWDEANFFFAALTPQQQDDVLHGGSVSVELKTLAAETYTFYHESYRRMDPRHVMPDGTEVPIPEPSTVSFVSVGANRRKGRLAPALEMVDSSGSMSWMATGHLEAGVRDAIKHAWMLPGDSTADPAGQREVAASSDDSEADRKIAAEDQLLRDQAMQQTAGHPSRPLNPRLGVCLARLSEGGSIPVLAMLPPGAADRFESPIGKPAQKFIDKLEGNLKRHFYKWRNGVLLVSYPDWFTESVPAIPYAMLGRLHPDSHGHVPVPELADLMTRVTDGQAEWFAQRAGIAEMKRLRPCLLFAARHPKVFEPNGAHIDAETFQALRASTGLLPLASRSAQADPVLRIRDMPAGADSVSGDVLVVEAFHHEARRWVRLGQFVFRLRLDLFTREPVP